MPAYKAILVAAAVVAGAAYWYLDLGGEVVETAGFQTQALSTGRIESLVNTAGTISPVVSVVVGSELSGLVSELHADFNSEVASGQVIARIDDRTIRARLRQIGADVAAAEANIEQQQASVARAEADLELAHTDVKRQRELVKRQLSSQADLDRTEANVKIMDAQLAVARSQLTGARATLLQREAQFEQTQLDLDRTYIRSPVDGTVINRQVDVGQTVAASLSAPILFEIAQDLTQMQIEADVDEADIGRIREGLAARFTVDAYPDRTFTGRVTQVRKAATVTQNVVTYKVIIGAENPRQQLLPGMTANVNIVLGQKDDVLRVNNSALRFNPPGVEPEQDGGSGGRPAERLAALTADLDLDAAQRRAVESVFEEMQAGLAEFRRGFQGGGPPMPGSGISNPRERMQQARQRMINQLNGVLTPEQLARFEQSLNSGFGGRPAGLGTAAAGAPDGSEAGRPAGGHAALADMRPGRVWILEGGKPKSVRVLVGLADDQYTEIVSRELKAGDHVILRLSR